MSNGYYYQLFVIIAGDNAGLSRWMLQKSDYKQICFNMEGIQTDIQAVLEVEFEAFSPAEDLLQQNRKNVEANENG